MALKWRIKIKIKGLNQERALNKIIKKIDIYNFKRESFSESSFEVDYRKSKLARKILQDEKFEILSQSHHGITAFFRKAIFSYGLIAGLIFSSFCYAVQYNFIFKVQAYGNDDVKMQVETFVENSLQNRLKSKIKTKEIETQIREKFDEVSSVSVAIVGQCLLINLNEIDLPSEMDDSFKPIISEFDGLVCEIKLVQGTLAVEVGEIVKKGDVLVYPYIIDSQGKRRETQPKATILADVWVKGQERVYDKAIKSIKTGRVMKTTEILLGEKVIYSNEKQCDFKNFEKETFFQFISKNNVLPLVRRQTVYHEINIFEENQDFFSMKDQVIENARKKALIFLQENEIIKEEKHIIKEGCGWHEVSYVVTVERNIGG